MIRLAFIILFFLGSLFCIVKAPAFPLWFVQIVASEFPWIFIAIELVLLSWNFNASNYRLFGFILIASSLVLYSSPIVRAYAVSYNLSKKLTDRFALAGTNASGESPFQFTKMFTGAFSVKVPYHTMDYAHRDGKDLTLDYYPHGQNRKRPCVLVVHGGSWESGNSQQLPELNSVLAQHGYAVASINYRLAPEFKSPSQELDVADAISFLQSKSDSLQIDPGRIILLGRSAGGQIALNVAYRLAPPGVIGVIGFYAPADMAWGYMQPANPLIMDSRKVMENYLGGTDQQVPKAYFESTAINYVKSSSVPTLLIHGRNDVLVFYEHSVRLSAALEKNKVPHLLLTWPWGTHGSDYTLNGPAGQLSTYSVISFIKMINATRKTEKAR